MLCESAENWQGSSYVHCGQFFSVPFVDSTVFAAHFCFVPLDILSFHQQHYRQKVVSLTDSFLPSIVFRQQTGAEPGGGISDAAAPHAADKTSQPGHLCQDTRRRHCRSTASEGKLLDLCSTPCSSSCLYVANVSQL